MPESNKPCHRAQSHTKYLLDRLNKALDVIPRVEVPANIHTQNAEPIP